MTIKQKIAVQKTLENGGVVSRAMEEAGYSPAMAKNPQKLTESKGWKELMEAYLPDDKLLKVHDEALNATKIVTSHTEPDKTQPDYFIRLKATELGYKVKGKLQPEVLVNKQVNNIIAIPSELMEKYGITSNTEDSSKG